MGETIIASSQLKMLVFFFGFFLLSWLEHACSDKVGLSQILEDEGSVFIRSGQSSPLIYDTQFLGWLFFCFLSMFFTFFFPLLAKSLFTWIFRAHSEMKYLNCSLLLF